MNGTTLGYLFENSDPERFQRLCQSLLLPEFPGLQCFPVGQPDGGRDAVHPETGTIVQVKFKRKHEDESADWLITALKNELPKILELVSKGAKRYLIVTNAAGTAHPDSGRIDLVQDWLDKNVPVPSSCLWRDDLERRLDSAPGGLKLKHTEILTWGDRLEVYFEQAHGADGTRRKDALRSFIHSQFDRERILKFKQVNISNDLAGMFVDVPVGFTREVLLEQTNDKHEIRSDLRRALAEFGDHGAELEVREEDSDFQIYPDGGFSSVGAAEFFLASSVQDNLKYVMLEGAPGQGKSTLTQFVCQVHRARFLGKTSFLESLSDRLQPGAFRIPIRVDLRDFSKFLSGQNPFPGHELATTSKTLQEFLALLVSASSSGVQFTPHDMLSVAKESPVLLFLDGLDEVADAASRQELITSITQAISMWEEFEADLQVVITSRPSTFGSTIEFNNNGFFVATLQNINEDRVTEYTGKWVQAKGLDSDEALDLVTILDEKLELPHIQDLTRNPMQLAILLTLIHQVGHSLPDERTRLYSEYLDTFLTREAEKSSAVRAHKKVLIGFIGFLAWKLQSQAESSGGLGSISEGSLQTLAKEYLAARGRDTSIADSLFGGGLERIFVLVERNEGLFEFEVQPIREYFCASYLYENAPIGTVRHRDVKGDRGQRFEAIVANPFWLNVCRFYAGLCTTSELSMLVQSLRALISEGNVEIAIQARKVAIELLKDWIFSESKFNQDDLILAVVEEPGLSQIISDDRWITSFRLPEECGQTTLRNRLVADLHQRPLGIEAAQLCDLIALNGGHKLFEEFVQLLGPLSGPERTLQLGRMIRCRGTSNLDPAVIWELLTKDAPPAPELWKRVSLLQSSAPRQAESVKELPTAFMEGVLSGILPDSRSFDASPLGIFASILSAPDLEHSGFSIYGSFSQRAGARFEGPNGAHIPESLKDFLKAIDELSVEHFEILETNSPMQALDGLVDCALASFGPNWAVSALAISYAGDSSFIPPTIKNLRLFDPTIPLCTRARLARLRRSGGQWWRQQLDDAISIHDKMFWAGMVLSWASLDSLVDVQDEINTVVDSLSREDYLSLSTTLRRVFLRVKPRRDRQQGIKIDLRGLRARAAALVLFTAGEQAQNLLFDNAQKNLDPLKNALTIQNQVQNLAAHPDWNDINSILTWSRRVLAFRAQGRTLPVKVIRRTHRPKISRKVSHAVLMAAQNFPSSLVETAMTQTEIRYRPQVIADIAHAQEWEALNPQDAS